MSKPFLIGSALLMIQPLGFAQDAYQGLSPVVQAPQTQIIDAGNGWNQPLPASQSPDSTLADQASSSPLGPWVIAAHWRYENPSGSALRGSSGIGSSIQVPLRDWLLADGSFTWSTGNNSAAPTSPRYHLRHFMAGARAIWNPSADWQFFAGTGFSFAQLDTRHPQDGFDEAALYLKGGFQLQLNEKLQGVSAVRVSTHQRHQFISLDLEANYSLLRNFDLSLGTEYGDFSRSLRAGGRYRW
jgi:hypothetical protein